MQNSLTSPPRDAVDHCVSPSKRKRADSGSTHDSAISSPFFAALVGSLDNGTDNDDVLARGAQSPRSKMAERLRGLDLSSPSKYPRSQSPSDDVRAGGRTQGQGREGRDATTASSLSHSPRNTRVRSLTPSPSPSPSSRSSPSLYRFAPYPTKPLTPPAFPPRASTRRRLTSPPPPAMRATPDSSDLPLPPLLLQQPHPLVGTEVSEPGIAVPPLAAGSDAKPETGSSTGATGTAATTTAMTMPAPNLASSWWQPAEITGHQFDPARNPDDDGEGIDGVGFRPTPAVAYARSLRRKQQVSEWKAREAREARQKRFERRRGWGSGGGKDGAGGGGGIAKARMVRFAGVS